MLLRTEEPAAARIEACALTELALGEDRRDTAFKLICTSLALLSDIDNGGGTPARTLAARLRGLAQELEDA